MRAGLQLYLRAGCNKLPLTASPADHTRTHARTCTGRARRKTKALTGRSLLNQVCAKRRVRSVKASSGSLQVPPSTSGHSAWDVARVRNHGNSTTRTHCRTPRHLADLHIPLVSCLPVISSCFKSSKTAANTLLKSSKQKYTDSLSCF